mmetsp:Transcript_78116/g.123285  ORF Transcript_78116/g.123285 Transcript_78116/m.123285 type:complete len:531 (-) Transcript_78116:126-1718(-)
MPYFSKEQLLELAAVASVPDGPRVAVAGMQKNPPDFIDWMYYHICVGVWGFIIRFEDPDAELSDLLQRLSEAMAPRFVSMPRETSSTDGGLQDVMHRAMNFITNDALPMARRLDIDYVLWIDSDELIFPVADTSIAQSFAAIPHCRQRGFNPWHRNQPEELVFASFQNYEARFPHPHCQDQPFTTQGTRFMTDTRYFELYAEGKPAAYTHNLKAQATTPHSFSGGDMAAMPPSLAVVLHFDSPGFDPWLKKWIHHAKGDRSKPWDKGCLDKFRYYRDSIEVVSRDSTMEDKLRIYSSYRCLPPPELQARDPKWAGLVDFDILAKIFAARRIVAPSLGSSNCRVAEGQLKQPLSDNGPAPARRSPSNAGRAPVPQGTPNAAPPGAASLLMPAFQASFLGEGFIQQAQVGQSTRSSVCIGNSAFVSPPSCQSDPGGYPREQKSVGMISARSVEAPRLIFPNSAVPKRSNHPIGTAMPHRAPRTARVGAWPVRAGTMYGEGGSAHSYLALASPSLTDAPFVGATYGLPTACVV